MISIVNLKLIRKFFGFEKAQTPGMLSNATGAAIAMNTINRLLRPLPPRHKVNRKDYDGAPISYLGKEGEVIKYEKPN